MEVSKLEAVRPAWGAPAPAPVPVQLGGGSRQTSAASLPTASINLSEHHPHPPLAVRADQHGRCACTGNIAAVAVHAGRGAASAPGESSQARPRRWGWACTRLLGTI